MLGPLLLLPLIFAPTDGLGVDEAETHIYGGDYVDSCGWPSTVYLENPGGGACTAALVHPFIVLTAAHCITDGTPATVRFGETAQTAMRLADTENCRQNPGWTGATAQGQDYGYCKLAAPITNVPIVPVAGACEQTAIRAGARIMHVGFGVEADGSSGRKKMLDTTINAITGTGELISGTFDEIICNGDSGGPTFVYLDPSAGGDGTWRVAAVHSWAQGADPVNPMCTGQAGSVLVTQAIPWIEEDSGIDITPCSDGNEWNPTAQCGGMPLEPWVGDGSYPMGCQPGELMEWSGVCGPALDETADDTAPVVTVLTPTDDEEFAPDGGSALVNVEVDATDVGWGVAEVALTVRSAELGEQEEVRNEWQPWEFAATLPVGAYEVVAIATDHAGNESEPVTVCFGVGEPGCPEVDDTGTDTDTDGPMGTGTSDPEPDPEPEDEGEAETTGDMPPARGEDTGCGCRSGSGGPASAVLALLFLGAAQRRRFNRG